MKKIISILLLITFLVSPVLAFAITKPCTEEELLSFSDFAIEGYVVNIEHTSFFRGGGYCRKEYNGEWRQHWENEVYVKSIATIEVTKNLKGDFNIGDKAEISFFKFLGCKEGTYVPLLGDPIGRNIPLYAKIRYYHNTGCWNNVEIIGKLLVEEAERPEKLEIEKEIETIDWIYYLIFFGILFFILILVIIFLKKRKIKDGRIKE